MAVAEIVASIAVLGVNGVQQFIVGLHGAELNAFEREVAIDCFDKIAVVGVELRFVAERVGYAESGLILEVGRISRTGSGAIVTLSNTQHRPH